MQCRTYTPRANLPPNNTDLFVIISGTVKIVKINPRQLTAWSRIEVSEETWKFFNLFDNGLIAFTTWIRVPFLSL